MGQLSEQYGQGEDDDAEFIVTLPGELHEPEPGPGPEAGTDPEAHRPGAGDSDNAGADADADGGGPGGLDGGGEEFSVDLDDWSPLARDVAADRLREAGVPHWWVGSSVHGAAEDADDIAAVLDEVESEPEPLDPDEDQLAYDMSEWDDDRLSTLGIRLDDAEIPFAWDGEELFVYARDEEAVDKLIEAVENPHELPAEPDEEGDGDGSEGGEVGIELLGDLFVAADHLQHDPSSHEHVAGLLLASQSVDEDKAPYGFAPSDWRHLVERVDTLADVLCEDEPDQEAVVEAAGNLRTSLRPYV